MVSRNYRVAMAPTSEFLTLNMKESIVRNLITAMPIFILVMVSLTGTAMGKEMKPVAPNVDLKTGAITVPEDYTKWATLGTWAHANMEGEPGSHEYHVDYTQPETIAYYQKHGSFPDGAVLVKEAGLGIGCVGVRRARAVKHHHIGCHRERRRASLHLAPGAGRPG